MWSFAAVFRLGHHTLDAYTQIMTTIDWQFERSRLRVGLAVLLLLVAQIAAAAHLVGHGTQGDTAGCNICLHAGQLGSALLPSALPQAAVQSTASELVGFTETQVFSTYPAVYRARAPPASF
ncbi:MAG: hypothetical protein ABIX37_03130 [Gammaproteobacteria bacterium]